MVHRYGTLEFLRLLVLMHLRSAQLDTADAQWSMASSNRMFQDATKPSPPTNYFALAFFAIAIGGPWLMWKLLRRIVQSVDESRRWTRGESEYYEARALYDFVGAQPTELAFKTGALLRVAPKGGTIPPCFF